MVLKLASLHTEKWHQLSEIGWSRCFLKSTSWSNKLIGDNERFDNSNWSWLDDHGRHRGSKLKEVESGEEEGNLRSMFTNPANQSTPLFKNDNLIDRIVEDPATTAQGQKQRATKAGKREMG